MFIKYIIKPVTHRNIILVLNDVYILLQLILIIIDLPNAHIRKLKNCYFVPRMNSKCTILTFLSIKMYKYLQ
jgi:hypothetical protein